MREAVNTTDAPGAEQGWLDWLAANGVPGDRGGRHPRARPPHPRGGRDARRDLPAPRWRRPRRCERVRAEPSMVGRDLAREVTGTRRRSRRGRRAADRRARHRHQALDRAQLHAARRQLELYPCTTPADELLARDPDGFFLVPGPGDPAALDYIVDTIRDAALRKPVFGICLGHQLLSRAAGLDTFKLPFGHRGANHPVKDLRDRPDRDHLAEPRLRGRGGGRPPARLGPRRRRDHAREPL